MANHTMKYHEARQMSTCGVYSLKNSDAKSESGVVSSGLPPADHGDVMIMAFPRTNALRRFSLPAHSWCLPTNRPLALTQKERREMGDVCTPKRIGDPLS